jgi:hypothetical protein
MFFLLAKKAMGSVSVPNPCLAVKARNRKKIKSSVKTIVLKKSA